MKITIDQLEQENKKALTAHMQQYHHLAHHLEQQGVNVEHVVQKLADFQVAIPS